MSKFLILDIYSDRGINMDMFVEESTFEKIIEDYESGNTEEFIVKKFLGLDVMDLKKIDYEQEVIEFGYQYDLQCENENHKNIQKKSFNKIVILNLDKIDKDFSSHVDVLYTINKHGVLDLEEYESM